MVGSAKLYSAGSYRRVSATKQREQPYRVDTATPGHPVFAVRGEDEVVVVQSPARTDLGCFLPQQRRPQPELTLSLQGVRLGVEAAHQHHVAEEPAQFLPGHLHVDLVVVPPFPLGREQLQQLGHVMRVPCRF